MCGIIGIIAKDTVASELLEGLRRLEYLGYDWPVLQPWSTNSGFGAAVLEQVKTPPGGLSGAAAAGHFQVGSFD